MSWRIGAVSGLSRREILAIGGLGALSLGLPRRGFARPAPPPPDLDAQSPIAPIEGPATGWLGDNPTVPHSLLWKLDEVLAAGLPPPRESADVVVVGAGMSGLGTAYLLRDRQPIVLDQAPRFGGNAKGERWNGIDLSIGAAYFAYAPRKSQLFKRFYGPLGLDDLWRESDGDSALYQGKIVPGFYDGATDPARAADFQKAEKYFTDVLSKRYPDMPPGEWQVLTEEELFALDRKSFREEVEGALGPLHPHLRTALEYYCWSSLGGSFDEISAAAGLNFYAAEFDTICALPGGNSRVAERLLHELRGSVPAANLRTSSTVVRVGFEGDRARVVVYADGGLYTIDAGAVVMACPKFVAARILPDLPNDQREAIGKISYRAYVVGNVLCNRPAPADFLDLYFLGDGVPPVDTNAAATIGATDLVMAQWAMGGHPEKSVLTLYRALPYEGGRPELLDDGGWTRFRDELTAQVGPILPLIGLSPSDVEEVRVARWGHALPLAAKGLVADGTVATARRTLRERVFFVEQDNWALPSLETCLTCALEAEPEIRRVLG